jgi:hypothetical protein
MQSNRNKCETSQSISKWKYKILPEDIDKKTSIYFEQNNNSLYIPLQFVQPLYPTLEEYITKNKLLWNIYCKKTGKIEPIAVIFNAETNIYSIIRGYDIYMNAVASRWTHIWVDSYSSCSKQEMNEYINKLLTKLKTYAPIITLFLKNITTPMSGKLDERYMYVEQDKIVLFNKLINNCFITEKRKIYKTLKMIVPLKYIVVFPFKNYFQSIKDYMLQIERNGYKIISVDNYWSDDDIYSGLNSIVKFYDLEDGIELFFEIEFHTPESHDLKIKNNIDYKKYNATIDIKEKCKLFDKITKEYKKLAIPANIMEKKVHKLEIKHSIPHPCAST